MVLIPDGYATSTLHWGGAAMNFPGACILGWDITNYSGSAADLAQDVLDSVISDLMDNLASQVVCTGVTVKFGPTDSGPSAMVSSTNPGGDTSAPTSPNVTYLVHKHTAMGGRRGRGRFYLPGCVESSVSPNGAIDPTKRAAVESNITAFFNGVIADLATPVLLHGESPSPMTPTPMLSATLDSRAATQRRRMRR